MGIIFIKNKKLINHFEGLATIRKVLFGVPEISINIDLILGSE